LSGTSLSSDVVGQSQVIAARPQRTGASKRLLGL